VTEPAGGAGQWIVNVIVTLIRADSAALPGRFSVIESADAAAGSMATTIAAGMAARRRSLCIEIPSRLFRRECADRVDSGSRASTMQVDEVFSTPCRKPPGQPRRTSDLATLLEHKEKSIACQNERCICLSAVPGTPEAVTKLG
jgi:hypothetical protein